MFRLQRYWDSYNGISLILWPLGLLFCALVVLRRQLYRWGLLKHYRMRTPVVVVGNISVGGSGKTPLVIWLAGVLREAGYRPGIVSRGYKGRSREWPRPVGASSDPQEVGDEPVLLARRCACPVVVGPDRVAAAQALLRNNDCDVILTDDGLQHYRLARDIEIAVIDKRRLGNGACLPAGPLREPPGRLRDVDFIVANGAAGPAETLMVLVGEHMLSLKDEHISCSLQSLQGTLVHAVAGIGDPARFFRYLQERGLRVLEHPFPDHHHYTPEDLDFRDEIPLLMTEKDAVKCQSWARDWYWYVPVRAQIDPRFKRRILERLAHGIAAGPNLLAQL